MKKILRNNGEEKRIGMRKKIISHLEEKLNSIVWWHFLLKHKTKNSIRRLQKEIALIEKGG